MNWFWKRAQLHLSEIHRYSVACHRTWDSAIIYSFTVGTKDTKIFEGRLLKQNHLDKEQPGCLFSNWSGANPFVERGRGRCQESRDRWSDWRELKAHFYFLFFSQDWEILRLFYNSFADIGMVTSVSFSTYCEMIHVTSFSVF